MKPFVALLTVLLTILPGVGCSKKENIKMASAISATGVAVGAKTKSGKPVDVYEVHLDQASALVLVVGGGRLEASGPPASLRLDGQMVEANSAVLANRVVILEKKLGRYTPIPSLTPAEAKPKCSVGKIIDLPIDETLAALSPEPGSPQPRR